MSENSESEGMCDSEGKCKFCCVLIKDNPDCIMCHTPICKNCRGECHFCGLTSSKRCSPCFAEYWYYLHVCNKQ